MLGISNILQGIKRFLMKTDNENLSGAGDLYLVGLLNNQTLSGYGVLRGYGDKYVVVDNRKRARKEPGELSTNKNLEFTKVGKAAENYNKDAFNTDNFKKVVVIRNFDGTFIEFNLFEAQTKSKDKIESRNVKKGADGIYYNGSYFRVLIEPKYTDLYNIADYVPGKYQAYITVEKYDEFFNEALKYLFDSIKREINIRKEQIERLDKDLYFYYQDRPERKKKEEKRLNEMLSAAEKKLKYNVAFYNYSSLGKPQIKFEFETNEELQKFLNKNKENLIDSYVDVDEYDFEKKALNGIDDDIFNCSLDQLDCKGLKPTYIRLANYDSYVDSAENENTLLGYGFDKATINTLRNTVLDNYKQVARLAPLLRGESDLQTFFNIWYFLHEQIRYALDEDGKEEIRTPARAWADRKSGIDCDCLAVLTASILINLGYKPRFEIVAMNNSNCYEHIYVVCNDIVIDRVLPNFNERPKNVTKTLIMDIPVYQLSGVKGCSLKGINDEILEDDSILKTDSKSSQDEYYDKISKVVINMNDNDSNSNSESWQTKLRRELNEQVEAGELTKEEADKIFNEKMVYRGIAPQMHDNNMPYSSSIVADNEVDQQRKNDNSLGVFAGLAAVGLIVALCSNSKK